MLSRRGEPSSSRRRRRHIVSVLFRAPTQTFQNVSRRVRRGTRKYLRQAEVDDNSHCDSYDVIMSCYCRSAVPMDTRREKNLPKHSCSWRIFEIIRIRDQARVSRTVHALIVRNNNISPMCLYTNRTCTGEGGRYTSYCLLGNTTVVHAETRSGIFELGD